MTLKLPVIQESEHKRPLSPSGLPFLSVSQVDTALGKTGCEHKWSLQYQHLVTTPEDGSTIVGSRVHKIAEDWLTFGTPPDDTEELTVFHRRKNKHVTYYPGQIFRPGMLLLPPPGSVKVESGFKLTTDIHGEPIWWRGAKDLEWTDSAGLVWIGDHKTSISFSYQKSEADLRGDWQASLYALEAMNRLGVDRLGLAWFTYITDPVKRRDCRAVRLVVERGPVTAVVSELERKGRVVLSRYQTARDTGKIAALTKNRNACGAYGGCGFENSPHCARASIEDLFEGVTTVSNQYQNFLNDVDARVPGAAPAPVAPPPAVRPSYWMPGDPLNDTQQFLSQSGAKLSMVANSANVPPPPEVAQSYDRPASVMLPPPPPVPSVPAPVLTNEAPTPPPGLMNTPQGMVPDPRYDPATFARPPINPLDQINAPERPTVAPIVPEELQALAPPVAHTAPVSAPAVGDDLDKMDRDQLKAYGMARGIFQSGERRGAPALLAALRAIPEAPGSIPTPAAVQTVDSSVQVSTVCPPTPVTHEVQSIPLTDKDRMNGVTGRYEIVPPIPVAQPVQPPPVPFQETVAAGTFEDFGIVGIVRTPEETQPRGFSLYINCSPVGEESVTLADVLATVMPKVRQLTGQPDFRLVEYGKGAGVLANTVRTYLLENPFSGRKLVVDARTPEGTACLGVLEELASNVVRGW